MCLVVHALPFACVAHPVRAMSRVVMPVCAAALIPSILAVNGYALGVKLYGYTTSRYFIESSQINWNGADNVLAVLADCTQPDSWW